MKKKEIDNSLILLFQKLFYNPPGLSKELGTKNNLEMLLLTSCISTFAGGGGEGDELPSATRCGRLADTLSASCCRRLCSTCNLFLTHLPLHL